LATLRRSLLPVPRHATGAWLEYELHESSHRRAAVRETGPRVYDEITEKLASPEFRPRALFERFAIEVLATTDKASDPLQHHQDHPGLRVAGTRDPCFRPDAVFQIASPAGRPSWKRWPGARRAAGGLR